MNFEYAFFWGFGGAMQAILTLDMTRFYSPYYFYISQISHGIIILNVLWMLIVFKLKIGKFSIHRTVLLTLVLMVIVGIFIFLIIFGIAIMWILDVLVKRI